MAINEIIKKLESLKNPKNIEGMARFGIRPKAKVLGIPVSVTRQLAKDLKESNPGKNHELALKLFNSGIHEAQILASLIAEPVKLTEQQINEWVKIFDSWDIVDQVCMNVFDKSKIALRKITEFSKREAEFEKRTAFSLIAAIASHNKEMQDKDFIKFFPLIKKASFDERNFVKKAVNWALRGIGKRNKKLNKEAIKLAREILKESARPNRARLAQSRAAKWIANDTIRELTGLAVQKRLK